MAFDIVIRFLICCLFALSANSASACCQDKVDRSTKSHQESSEKSCCSKDDLGASRSSDSAHQHPGSNCPCEHEKDGRGCHCPGCGTTCHSGAAAFAPDAPPTLNALVFNHSVQKQAFYFVEHLPEAVYLPIWQPPKIGA